MRESYAFILYFVVTDSIFYLVPILVSTFSIVRFLQELQKSLDFQRQVSTSANKKGLWNLTRSVFALDSIAFLLSLLTIVCFTAYWLVVDPNAVFLFETVHYLNLFFVTVVSVYFMVRKFCLLAKIFDIIVLK